MWCWFSCNLNSHFNCSYCHWYFTKESENRTIQSDITVYIANGTIKEQDKDMWIRIHKSNIDLLLPVGTWTHTCKEHAKSSIESCMEKVKDKYFVVKYKFIWYRCFSGTQAHHYLLLISEVEETEIFKICLEYWNTLSSELYRESPFPSTPSSPLLLGSANSSVPPRRQLYLQVLSRVSEFLCFN